MPADLKLGALPLSRAGRPGTMDPIRVNTSPSALLTSPTDTDSVTNTTQHECQIMQDEESLAVRRLLESWMDRLQLISVIAIFFASLEGTLLSITMPQDQGNPNLSAASQAANVGLTSGLLLHILAAFVSFLGGFFLIRYRIKWAKVEQKTVIQSRKMHSAVSNGSDDTIYQSPTTADLGESGIPMHMPSPGMPSPGMPTPQIGRCNQQDFQPRRFTPPPLAGAERPRKRRGKAIWILTEYPTLFSLSNPSPTTSGCLRSGSLGPRTLRPLPTQLLNRFHSLCVILTLLGFGFSLMGIVINAWERLPRIVGIVCTTITSITLFTIIWMMFTPDSRDANSDHAYSNFS